MRTLKKGDRVTLRKIPEETTVTVKDSSVGCFTDVDGKSYHIKGECDIPSMVEVFYEIIRIDSPPEGWPPQLGDVWKTENGRHYHYMNENSPKFYPAKGRLYEDVSANFILSRNPTLVYRGS